MCLPGETYLWMRIREQVGLTVDIITCGSEVSCVDDGPCEGVSSHCDYLLHVEVSYQLR